jgi:hypothetical protein
MLVLGIIRGWGLIASLPEYVAPIGIEAFPDKPLV